MANKKEMCAFAVYWLEKYRNPDTTEREVIDGFDEACFALGFVIVSLTVPGTTKLK